jgi:hypothetical protein
MPDLILGNMKVSVITSAEMHEMPEKGRLSAEDLSELQLNFVSNHGFEDNLGRPHYMRRESSFV